MSSVSSIFARRMVEAAGPAVDAREELRSVGLDPDADLDVTEWIAAEAYFDLLERLAHRMNDGVELPLRAGARMRPDDYGALGLAWKSAPTVRGSLERVERYARLWTDNMSYELREHERGIDFVSHRFGVRRLGMRLSNEATAASCVSLIRQTALPGFCPLAVHFEHRAPSSTEAHVRYFGCPVHFGAEDDVVVVATADLEEETELADEGISRFLVSHLEKQVAELEDDALEALVRQAISKSLASGVPRMSIVARRLAMSERTLQRRLAERDLGFRELVETTRRQLAENLLHHSSYSLSEVAFLVGFSEQSAFNRAFRRWFDQTPTDFQRSRAS